MIFVVIDVVIALLVTFWRLAQWRFYALTFIRRTKVQIYEKLSYEALHRHFCQTRVTSWRSVVRAVKVMCDKGFAVNVKFMFGFLCVGCAVVVLKIYRREGDFKK
ncbi:MAG: hypothetical protein CVT95_05700 [Bacteroidetes bacterium HGW-Bacteroidetes-12]|nr:MAG: hypothetical protein CVT95_05700 [Bacteroidetes bacterium HGW-Bacteroidetes-12]